MKIRQGIDGSVWIPRKNPELEAELDDKYDRVQGALKWWPKTSDSIEELFGAHKGATAYILGKGPSLDTFVEDQNNTKPKSVIIALNEAGNILNHDFCYSIAKDKEVAALDLKGTPVICESVRSVHKGDTSLYYNETLSGYKTGSVLLDATALALKMGVAEIRFIGCDGIFGGSTDYSDNAVVRNSLTPEERHKVFDRERKRLYKVMGDFKDFTVALAEDPLVDETVVDSGDDSTVSEDVE